MSPGPSRRLTGMAAEARFFWKRLGANYWFQPALFSILAFALAITLVELDRSGWSDWLGRFHELVPARPDGAASMLSIIAGSTIAIASTVFSITIAAVSYASGTYGPRLLTNFMEDRGNQYSLATFIATFVYSLTVLRTIRGEDEVAGNAVDAAADALPGFVPQLSLLVAYGLMALSVAVLVYFLNHIPASIRINTVIEGIAERLLLQVEKAYPDCDCGLEPEQAERGVPVNAHANGYVQLIDHDDLEAIATEIGTTVSLRLRTGDFVHPGVPVAEVPDEAAAAALEGRLDEVLVLGATRTAEQDPQFLIDELVEIALRALSPAINDPFTAITVLHWLSAALADIGGRDLRRAAGERRVRPLPDDYGHFVRRSFGAVRSAVATSPRAALVAFDAIRMAAAPLESAERKALLREEGDNLIAQARLAIDGPDLADIEKRYARFCETFA